MSAARDVCLMLLVGAVLLSLVTAVDTGCLSHLVHGARSSRRRDPAVGVGEHVGVGEERERVQEVVAHGRRAEAALCVENIGKDYGSIQAVCGLSFALSKHECFGLLGMNGAGKTTTFRMLAGDLVPTAGNAYIGDADLVGCRRKYQERIGYCPQTDVALDLLTGREMLALFGRLRGIREADLSQVVNRTLEFVDMAQYADVTVGKCSGGTRRKLSQAVAFVGNPKVVLLDEPTAAVDPPARRRIWSILITAKQRLDLAILLSSHCMRECETLCSRFAILCQGRFACIGPTRKLKEDVGRGAIVLVHSAPGNSGPVSRELEVRFPGSTLRRRHQGGALLRFHVPAQPWHRLFAGLEELRATGLVSEYLVSDVSLSEVFLYFAHSRKDGGAQFDL